MIDIKWIRENSEALDHALIKRNLYPQAKDILSLDFKRRLHITNVQKAQEQKNVLSKEIGRAHTCGDISRATELRKEVYSLKKWLATSVDEARHLNLSLENILASLPNIPLEDVPFGIDENDNIELRRIGTIPNFNFPVKEHHEIGVEVGAMDFEHAGRISGARFTILSGKLARLERAIGQFMLDLHIKEHGYLEISPPLLVRESALYGVAQLPKFAEDLFQTNDKHWLIPTAEVPLTNLVADQILEKNDLPLRFVALTPCFRLEAGSAGRDTRGMLRQHQFWKVEMVSITDIHSSLKELERMTHCAENVLKRLELPFRVVTLCTGDMGFASRKTYDLEVWLPGQNRYREISSCSFCGDFQARRMRTRYRTDHDGSLNFVHTLNGSGTAVGRCLIAIIENYQTADGCIMIPQVLHSYMGGIKQIHVEK